MSAYRLQRVQNLLLEVTSEIIRELKDPRIGFVSVTEVEVSSDLRHARIHVSVLGSDKERKETLDALNSASGFVRRQLSQKVRLRYVPDIHFRIDETLAHGAHIIDLINEATGQQPPTDVSHGESGAMSETSDEVSETTS